MNHVDHDVEQDQDILLLRRRASSLPFLVSFDILRLFPFDSSSTSRKARISQTFTAREYDRIKINRYDRIENVNDETDRLNILGYNDVLLQLSMFSSTLVLCMLLYSYDIGVPRLPRAARCDGFSVIF